MSMISRQCDELRELANTFAEDEGTSLKIYGAIDTIQVLSAKVADQNLNRSEIPNSSDLISRQAAIDEIIKIMVNEVDSTHMWAGTHNEALHEALEVVRLLPSADRPTGEWMEMGQNKDGTHNVKCNLCGNGYKMRGHAKSISTRYNYRFCPHCGARMVNI